MVSHAVARLAEANRLPATAHARHGPGLQMLGTSGTVTTLAAVHLGLRRYDRRKVDGISLPFTVIQSVSRRCASSTMPAAAHPCIGHDRADLVVAGCAILDAVHRCWPVERLRVADRGLREGILNALLGHPGPGPAGCRPSHDRRSPAQDAAADRARPQHLLGNGCAASSTTRSSTRPASRGGAHARCSSSSELDERFELLKGGRVIDLGAAPGSWTQYAVKRGCAVVAVDLLPIAPVAGAILLEGDFLDPVIQEQLRLRLDGPADLVLSDMAAPATGRRAIDRLRAEGLGESVLEFAGEALAPGGAAC